MLEASETHPHAVVIPPEYEEISNIGHELRQLMRELTPAVKPLSIDKTFLDLSDAEALHKASISFVLAKFVQRIEKIGITISVGFSYCKFLAKVATDLKKPRALP